ncbi:MAG TPA: hypothetical protein VFU64_08575 [Gaiellaceae bacterium]|nr:hypothetical protein [Gaiellaceae bacterium]
MSSDLERRLEGLLAEAPEPEAGVGEKALARALSALRPTAPAHRGLRTAVLVFAAAVVLLAIAAGSLAAAGAIHVSFGAKKKQPPAVTRQLTLPRGANGIAAVLDGRLSVVIKGGFRLQGLRVTAAALSPHARYVAAGIRHSLVTIAPNGRRPWTHAADGKVVAIAWAPNGFQIAYVVHAGRHFVLHVIYGNGIHDRTIDRSVRAVRPSWRADSLAFAYVGGGGSAVVYDLGHQQHHVVPIRPPAVGVAFAPVGRALAVQTAGGVSVLARDDSRAARDVADGDVEAFGWLDGRLAVAVPGRNSALIRLFAPDGAPRGSHPVVGVVAAITPKHVVVRRFRNLVTGHTTLLTIPRGQTARDLAIG